MPPVGRPAAAADELARFGQDLFHGGAPLHGRMVMHTSDLPPAVVRCGNCHAAGSGAAVPRSAAPRLDARYLNSLHSRPGEPPFRYNPGTFCTLLRKGVDPAFVVIDTEMPRYQISDAECRALWTYLAGDAP